jgi:parallel beta-helix repeat protein
LNKTASGIVLILVLVGWLSLVFNIQPVKATGTIHIRADGSIDPPTAPISTLDNVTYTLTGNITSSEDGISVERNNVIIDGDGYTVQGSGIYHDFRGIVLDGRSNVTIKNTRITTFTYGIWFQYYSSNIGIYGNNIDNNAQGIYLPFSSNNRIIGNNITANGRGIWLIYSSGNSVIGNSFVNNGLLVHFSYGNMVSGNLVNGKPLVYLEGASDVVVGDAGQVILVQCNHIRVENLNLTSANVGVQLLQTNNTEISANNITANNYNGIYLASSSNNSISGNNIDNNAQGIGFEYSSNNNTIFENNVTNNGFYGIWLVGSDNNKFYHNSFNNPNNQVGSVDSTNIWDNGYPSGGNYWSDYTGVDEKSGPNQDQPGSDGIGDIPYAVGDRYPLMNPWAAPFPVARFTYSPKYPRLNETITFDASASYDSDGKVETYMWNFGDGNLTSSTIPTVTHIYTASSIYAVNLTVIDNDGLESRTTVSVKIRAIGEPLTVDDDGPADFHTIQEAVNAAGENDVIYVHNGTYYENVLLNKTGLTVIGESRSTTFIEVYYGDIVTITASNICISNFTLQPRYGVPYSSMPGVDVKSAKNCNILGNTIKNNFYGIYLTDSSDNTISANNIRNCYFGIELDSSSNNRIYHNNFIDNTYQVSQYASTNIWDDGYPSGGNYWSDYNSTDVYRGIYQNETGSDGIGDTPYVIDGNNQDNYPLISPYPQGDYNHDGVVNMTDAEMVQTAWQSIEGDLNYNPYVDCNIDGIINIIDATPIGWNWQKNT